MGKQTLTQEQVNLINKQLNTKKVIIGHTIYPEITPIYDGKVIAMDMNHNKNIKTGKVEALIIENGCFKQFVSTSNSIEKNDLFDDCNKLATVEKLKNNITIYPNPTTNWIYIDNIDNNSIIELYDFSGKKLNINSSYQANKVSINLQSIPKGTYLIKIIDQNNISFQQKILKK